MSAAAIPAEQNIRRPSETPTPWTGNRRVDAARKLIAMLGELSGVLEDHAAQVNIEVVTRTYAQLEKLAGSGRIVRYKIHGWKGNELMVDVFMMPDLYTTRRRSKIRDELDAAVEEFGFFVDATILIESTDGETPEAH